MKCTKTGRPVVYRKNHVYPGDEFTCESCGFQVIKCNSNGYHLEKALQVLEDANPVDMDKE